MEKTLNEIIETSKDNVKCVVSRGFRNAKLLSNNCVNMNHSYEQNMCDLKLLSDTSNDVSNDIYQAIVSLETSMLHYQMSIDSDSEIISLLLKIQNTINVRREHELINKKPGSFTISNIEGMGIAYDKLLDAILWISEYSTVHNLPK